MLPYAAYLRVYEPLSAFPEPARARWEAYATSATRPRRARALEAELDEALRRVVALPPIVAPEEESAHAYLRRVDDVLYVCPWQTRLRSWLAFARFRGSVPAKLLPAFVPIEGAERVSERFELFKQGAIGIETGGGLRTSILSSTWHVPITWFVPFDPAERWLVVSPVPEDRERVGTDRPEDETEIVAAPPRNLIYVTSMAQARRRTARALAVVRRAPDAEIPALSDPVTKLADLEDLGRWFEEFHPHALVELDYGGLVHVMDDDTLRGDQSVAEVAAVLSGLERNEDEVATAMHRRVTGRWRAIQAMESIN